MYKLVLVAWSISVDKYCLGFFASALCQVFPSRIHDYAQCQSIDQNLALTSVIVTYSIYVASNVLFWECSLYVTCW